MLGQNLPPYFSMPIFFTYSLLISLTLIYSSINKIGLSLAFTIIELKLSLRLFTRQSIKDLGEKWDLVHYAGFILARYFQASSSKLLRCSISLSNSLTDVVNTPPQYTLQLHALVVNLEVVVYVFHTIPVLHSWE